MGGAPSAVVGGVHAPRAGSLGKRGRREGTRALEDRGCYGQTWGSARSFLLLEQGRSPGRRGDSQHHRQPPCRLMAERPPPGSWNRLVTRSVPTFHTRMVPSTLHEYTWLEVRMCVWSGLREALCTL